MTTTGPDPGVPDCLECERSHNDFHRRLGAIGSASAQWRVKAGLPSTPKTPPSHEGEPGLEVGASSCVPSAIAVASRVVSLSVLKSAATSAAAAVALLAAAAPAAAAAAVAAAVAAAAARVAAFVAVIALSWASEPLNTLRSVLGLAPARCPESVYCQNV